jgi:hypothetical protein
VSNGNSIINLGDLAKPATVLIEKISDAVGTLFRPRQIKRIARAEAEAAKITAVAEVEVTEIQQRGLVRLIEQEGRYQDNFENVVAHALPELRDDAEPRNIDDDWLTKFFEESKLVSDTEMQTLWGRILAGEANRVGMFSKRTLQLVSNLSKDDAELFTNLMGFGWFVEDEFNPIVIDLDATIYEERNINFNSLSHLDDIGLVKFSSAVGFSICRLRQTITISYFGTPINVEFEKATDNELQIGSVLLTKAGQELAPISGSSEVKEFIDYSLATWQRQGVYLSSPFPQQKV